MSYENKTQYLHLNFHIQNLKKYSIMVQSNKIMMKLAELRRQILVMEVIKRDGSKALFD